MSKVSKYPENLRNEAKTAVKGGMTVKDASKALGVSQGAIRIWFNTGEKDGKVKSLFNHLRRAGRYRD